ncbi:MAG: hypothetical protein AAB229_02600 [Candidatus Hydrogenedentota bacterium]
MKKLGLLVRDWSARFFLNPVFILELRKQMRGNQPLFVITSYLLILFFAAITQLPSSAVSATAGVGSTGKNIFTMLFSLQLLGILFVAPGLTATAIPKEREKKTFPFLMTTLLGPGEILMGKLLVSVSYIGIMLLVAVPIHAIVFMTGGFSPVEILYAHFVLLWIAALCSSAGLAFGVAAKKSLGVLLFTYALVFLMAFPLIGSISMMRYARGSSPLNEIFELLTFGGIVKTFLFTALPFAAIVGLFFSFARERLAGWRQRSSHLRRFIQIFPYALPWYLFPVARITSARDIEHFVFGCFMMLAMYYLALIFLNGLRPPHRNQLREGFFAYAGKNILPQKTLKEDPVTFPFFLCYSFLFHVAVFSGVSAILFLLFNNQHLPTFIGHLASMGILVLYCVPQILFWSGFALAISIWMQPRRPIGLGTVLMVAVMIAFGSSIDWSLHKAGFPQMDILKSEVLSPIAFMVYFGEKAVQWRPEALKTVSESIFVYAILIVIAWSVAALGWKRLQVKGLKNPEGEDGLD